ncbi:MAG TPA: lactate racemase domain-containing protein [Candidatus Dormibacteraeota bacterium]|nr:lactate racemase domain-containing protein [Candidatus Dormibacteraeota bacterium]
MTTTVSLSVLDEFGGSKTLAPEKLRYVQASPLPSKPADIAFREAMATPVGAKPFEREKCWSPAIILGDSTRKQSPLVRQLFSLIEAKTDDIKIIFACGTHLPADQTFIRRIIGDDLYKKYEKSVKVSSTQNPASKYEWIGVTSRGTPVELNKELFDRDLLISSMNVQPHYFAGYEGGAKALLPGCSGLKTITTNHGYVIGNSNCRELMLKGNPLREDMNEVPGILKEFMKIEHRILDFVYNQNGTLVKAAYGDPILAHQQLAENFSRKAHTVQSRPSPLVLTRADGPMGQNLYQALKASAFATSLVPKETQPKPAVILLATLENGIGGEAFRKEMETYGKMEPAAILEDLKKRAKVGKVTEASQKPNRFALDDPRADYLVVSPKAPTTVEEFLAKTRIRFYRAIDDALGSLDAKLYEGDVALVPFGSATVPLG